MTFGGASISSTQSIASRSGPMVRGVRRHHLGDVAAREIADAVEAAPQVAVGEDAGDAPFLDRRPPSCPCPCRSSRRSRRAKRRVERHDRQLGAGAHDVAHVREQARGRASRPDASARSPRTEKPRASSSASASASPSASAAVVLAVGASPSGQASVSTLASRCTSAACASEDCSLPVIAISLRALALEVRRPATPARRSRPNSKAAARRRRR